MGERTAPRDRVLAWILFAGLALAVVAAWANGMEGAFTYDDKVEVIGNRAIRWLEHWRTVLGYNASRPLVILTWALDFRIWGGDDSFGYHLVNLAIHILNAGLLMLLGAEVGRRLGWERPLLPGAAAALLWSLHPMTTEAVTYVTGRSESLCSLFIAASVLEWLRWRSARETTAAERSFHLVFSLFSFVLAAFSKEVAAMVPFLILWCEICLPPPEGTRPGPARWWGFLPFALILAAALVTRKVLYGHVLTDLWLRPMGVQVLTQAQVWFQYVRLWLLPVGQSIFHDWPEAPWPPSPVSLAWVAALLALGAASVSQVRHRPWVPWATGWFALLLLPSSSLVPLRETMAEHRAYLAGWGLVFLGVSAARQVLPASRTVRVALVLLVGAILGLATHHRNRDWQTEVALWGQAVRHNPSSAEAWYGYGDALRFAGELDPSIEAYAKAAELDPESLDALNNLGISLAEQGRSEEARKTWLAILRHHPTYCKAHNNLGWLHFRKRAWDEAIAEFRTTLTWCPNDAQAHYALGNIYYGPRRDARAAIAHYEAVLAIDPMFSMGDLVKQRLLELTW